MRPSWLGEDAGHSGLWEASIPCQQWAKATAQVTVDLSLECWESSEQGRERDPQVDWVSLCQCHRHVLVTQSAHSAWSGLA